MFYNCQHIYVHKYADQVLMGNEILVDENNQMTSAKVINISSFKAQGKH